MTSTRSILYLALGLSLVLFGCGQDNLSGPTPDDGSTSTVILEHAAARSGGGISGYSGITGSTCMVCHNSPNGDPPLLKMTGPGKLETGATGSFTVTLTPSAVTDQQAGGVDIAADGGILVSLPGQGTIVQNGEIIHDGPKAGTGSISWNFDWTAPSSPGVHRIYAASLSANGKNGTAGDEVGTVDGFLVSVESTGSTNPIANAGPDQILFDDDGDGLETVVLDGSASTDVDGKIVTWDWSENGAALGSGETTSVLLALGVHTILLTVTDDAGLAGTDEVMIDIRSPVTGGEALYAQMCGGCHGDPGSLDPAPAAPQKLRGARTCSIEASINGNAAFPDGVPAMQFLQGQLGAADIESIADYLDGFETSAEDRYRVACGGCHGPAGEGGRWEDVRGESENEIAHAIADEDEMNYLGCLPSTDLTMIAMFLDNGDDGDDDDDGDHGDGDHDDGDDDDDDDGDHDGGDDDDGGHGDGGHGDDDGDHDD